MHTNKIKVGDTVAINGLYRLTMQGKCQYTPEQMKDGLLLKHGTDEVWTGVVSEIKGDMAKIGRGGYGLEILVLRTK